MATRPKPLIAVIDRKRRFSDIRQWTISETLAHPSYTADFSFNIDHILAVDVDASEAIPRKAKEFLSFVREKWDQTSEPQDIIFLACDLGALILKEALVLSSSSDCPTKHQLLSHVRAVIFFGSPHRETPTERWESTLLRIVLHLRRNDRPACPDWLPAAISKLSHEHRRVGSRFATIAHKFRILQCIQDPTSPEMANEWVAISSKILSQEVSTLGFRGEEKVLIKATPDRLRDCPYLTHQERVKGFQHEALETSQPQFRWLLGTLSGFSSNLRNEVPPTAQFLFPQTANQLFKQKKPKQWLCSDAPEALAISVPPGFSNDHLLRSLCSHVTEVRDQGLQKFTVISADLSQLHDSHWYGATTAFPCSLILQILQQRPSTYQTLLSLFSHDELVSAFQGTSNCLLPTVLRRCLISLVSANINVACILLLRKTNETDNRDYDLSSVEFIISLLKEYDCNLRVMVVHGLEEHTDAISKALGTDSELEDKTSMLHGINETLEDPTKSDVLSELELLILKRPEWSEIQGILTDAVSKHSHSPVQIMAFIRSLGGRPLLTGARLQMDLDDLEDTAAPAPSPTQSHIELAKLARMRIALSSMAPGVEGQPSTDIKAKYGLLWDREREMPEMQGKSEEALLSDAALSWPFHLLKALSGTSRDLQPVYMKSVWEETADEGLEMWFRLWVTLRGGTGAGSPSQLSLRLSPFRLCGLGLGEGEMDQRISRLSLSPLESLKTCLFALDSLEALDYDVDLALASGLLKSVGAVRAAEYWHYNGAELQELRGERLFKLFTVTPSLTLALVGGSALERKLPRFLHRSIMLGDDCVWSFMEKYQVGKFLRLGTTDSRLALLLQDVDGGTHESEPSSPSTDMEAQLYDPERPFQALGLAEFMQRTILSNPVGEDAEPDVNNAALHAAVTSGNLKAVQALTRSKRISDQDWHAIGAKAVKLASTYGFVAILDEILPLLQQTHSGFVDKGVGKEDRSALPLHLAAERGFIRSCAALIKHGTIITCKDNGGNTALLAAVKSGNLRLVRLLCRIAGEQGQLAVCNEPNEDGLSPLSAALGLGHLPISELLFEKGRNFGQEGQPPKGIHLDLAVKYDFPDLLQALLKRYDFSINIINEALETAKVRGFAKCVSILLQGGATDPPREHLLIVAAEDGDRWLVEALLSSKVSIGSLGEPLQYAVIQGHVEICKQLLDAGADKDYQDTMGNNALQLAAYGNHLGALEVLLLRRANTELKDSDGATALSDAAKKGHYAAAKLLVDAGADADTVDNKGLRPFDLAMKGEDQHIMRLLLPNMTRASVEKEGLLELMIDKGMELVVECLLTIRGANPPSEAELRSAIYKGNVKIVKLLLRHGADPNAVENDDEPPPLHHAAATGNVEVVKALLDKENPRGRAEINRNGGYYWSVLYSCVGSSIDDEVKQTLWDLLIAEGADPTNSAGPRGTVLHYASRHSSAEMCQYIIDHCDGRLTLESKDQEGRIPTHFSTMFTDAYDLFMTSKLLCVTDKQGRLPIHIAAATGSLQALYHIITTNSLVNMLSETDNDGWNALHWACRQGDKEVISEVLNLANVPGPNGDLLVHDLCGARENLYGWQPRDVAIVHDNGRFLDLLDNVTGRKENMNESAAPGPELTVWESAPASCDSCFASILGVRHKCKQCFDFDLCFKCYTHVKEIHPAGHVFETSGQVDLDNPDADVMEE